MPGHVLSTGNVEDCLTLGYVCLCDLHIHGYVSYDVNVLPCAYIIIGETYTYIYIYVCVYVYIICIHTQSVHICIYMFTYMHGCTECTYTVCVGGCKFIVCVDNLFLH